MIVPMKIFFARQARTLCMHVSRLRSLCIEIYKTMKKQNPIFMQDIFQFKSVCNPNRSSRHPNDLIHHRPNQVTFGTHSFRPRLHGIGSKCIRTQSVTDRPCVYTGLDGSEPIWICYPYPNGITFEGDPVWIRSQKSLV